ncbi:MAG TPA: glycoside hydrolase family 2 TIM barrel-domain containing protein, partial [Vicinamibacteria bacterium]|nr:glycoside hydrolase family 2 TIM barrel-domain containing protein [Vicinamibacteria bacterium]
CVGSANYAARVWVDGTLVGEHEGGHLPFSFDVTRLATPGRTLAIAIRVENELKPTRVPAGNLPPGARTLFSNNPPTTFDFFPYAGLHRAVTLVAVPLAAIEDVTVRTTLEGDGAAVSVKVAQTGSGGRAQVRLRGDGADVPGALTFTGHEGEAVLRLPKARRWSPQDPFLYDLTVSLLGPGGTEVDRYSLEVGVRTIEVKGAQILLNGKAVFLKGFGRHEDFAVSGRGENLPVMIRDHALMKWAGANSYRTSHYPYAEEQMRLADRQGFLVIDEIPAVSLHFGDGEANEKARLAQCEKDVRDLIARDKNHPSVIAWSVSNEAFPPSLDLSGGPPKGPDPVSTAFLGRLIGLAHELDATRPATLVAIMGAPMEWMALGDIVCLNRYWGWYTQPGDLVAAGQTFEKELDAIHARIPKPIVVTEFGADTLPGDHSIEGSMWSEEYQVAFLKTYLDVADRKDYVAGMHVWCFADFRTAQATLRPDSLNHKGVFTRDREPKMAARFLHDRWGAADAERRLPLEK